MIPADVALATVAICIAVLALSAIVAMRAGRRK